MTARDVQERLRAMANPADAAFLAGFFKTGPGQYGEGDRFLGIRVPAVRAVAREFRDLPLPQVRRLLHSPLHEERLCALIILTHQAAASRDPRPSRRSAPSHSPAGSPAAGAIYRLYLAEAPRYVNNWDLVDLSAPALVGEYLVDRSRRPLYALARRGNLWQRRIAVLATFAFLRRGDFADCLALAELLLADRHDLIHKAVGWMLREVGKRDAAVLEAFLTRHAPAMPRTMLRYAIERFPPAARRRFMTMR